MEYATARSGVCRVRVIAAQFRGHEVEPAFLGASFGNQRLYILLGVGAHYEEDEVGPDCTCTLESCVELEGDGDG